MIQYWSFVLTAVGLTGFFLAGKKIWWAWYVNICNQILWLIYAWVSGQLGFWIGALIYSAVFIKNARDWTKEHYYPNHPIKFQVRRWNYPESTPMRHLRGRYDCVWCGAGEYDWCKDDCIAIDPYDWR